MVIITFEDRATKRKALGFLLGRFAGRVLKSGEHLVPESALEALAEQNISFTVKGKANYEQQVAAIRGAAPEVQAEATGALARQLSHHHRVSLSPHYNLAPAPPGN